MRRTVLSTLFVSAAALVLISPALAADTCSQTRANGIASCEKKNSREQCARVMGARYDACMQTGCWRGEKTNRCGFKRS